ncbi:MULTISPECIES: MFS transporter [Rhizobium]|uniref:Transcription regulator HTH AraC N-terminal domain-containing protein n=1 Tax=Rhizobium tropici TaxID=398 RepID=A0ABR6QW58_RHITR|nr:MULTISPECIES: MFS transporter [Rhizobium]AGB73980.1 transcriptional regulator, AraC family [Rhizobium tropici CIAT 899]MBB4240464.1 hypothetical protein [Rhizobium tropici]MBB5592120.1 hypothetical protein [Rhizobium tropici]MBB6491175.1 hypothetical protein [Rhizobium tropici]
MRASDLSVFDGDPNSTGPSKRSPKLLCSGSWNVEAGVSYPGRSRLSIYSSTRPTELNAPACDPTAIIVLQGTKRSVIGDQVFEYGSGQTMVVAEIPVMGQIVEASPEKPFLAINLTLDPAVIMNVVLYLSATPEVQMQPGFTFSMANAELIGAWQRLLAMCDRPEEIPVMALHLEHELMFRLMLSPHAEMLRQIASIDSRLSHIRRAMTWIREHYTEQPCCHSSCRLRSALTPSAPDFACLPWTATLFVTAPVAGAVVNKFGERPLVVTGLLMQAIGLGWIANIISPAVPYSALVAPLVLAGVGVSMAMPAAQNAILSSVSVTEMGKASGVFNMGRFLGGMFGIAALVASFSANGSVDSAAHFESGFAAAMGLAATLSSAGAIAGFFLPARRRVASAAAPQDG